MKKLLTFLTLFLMLGGVASTKEVIAQLVTDPDSIKKIDLCLEKGSFFCKNFNFFYELASSSLITAILGILSILFILCIILFVFSIAGIYFISFNRLYFKIVSDFSSSKEKVRLADNDDENAKEGQGASFKLLKSSIKWMMIFGSIILIILLIKYY